jgi:hypothetical protein
MHLRNAAVLETVFALQGDFVCGLTPAARTFEGGIEAAPFRGDAPAACCISADFEMGWAYRSCGLDGARRLGDWERTQFPLILSMLDAYGVPITWATVGHLFLESCTRSGCGLAHPDMPRPLGSDGTWDGDWYACDPCSNVREAPAWYAPDLIQQIIESPIPHDIGTHSFSHINCRAQYASRELVSRELAECVKVMEPFGIRPRSLVFPRNRDEYGYLPELAAGGVVVVRHRDRTSKVKLSYPERMASGVYRIYESMNLRIAKYYDYLQKVKIFIRKAMARRAVYALWFHPSDPRDWFDPQLREILGFIRTERDAGRLWVATMQQLAAYSEARDRLAITVDRNDRSLTLSMRCSMDHTRYGAADVTLSIPVASPPASTVATSREGSVEANTRFVQGRDPKWVVTVPSQTDRLLLEF